MKLFNIFKKETAKTATSNIQKMDKKQLEKVIGGGEPIKLDSGPRVNASQNSQTL